MTVHIDTLYSCQKQKKKTKDLYLHYDGVITTHRK